MSHELRKLITENLVAPSKKQRTERDARSFYIVLIAVIFLNLLGENIKMALKALPMNKVVLT